MADEVFKASVGQRELISRNLDINTTNGLACVWTVGEIQDKLCLIWTFKWDQLRAEKKIAGFTGRIVCDIYEHRSHSENKTLDVNSAEENKVIHTELHYEDIEDLNAEFNYTLIPIFEMTEIYDEMFFESEKNDAILDVDGMKLHVNRAFLSYHSDYFSALFSSKYKEGQMTEIPIKEVTYEEIGLLLSTIYPKAVFPNDRTVPKLLVLADRFDVPSVIHHVEYHLLNNSKIDNEKMMWMADRYGMELLFEKMVKELDSVAKAKKLKASPDYGELSNKAKAMILDKVMGII